MCDAKPTPLCRRRWWTCAAMKAATVRWLEYSAAATAVTATVAAAAIGWSIPRTTKGWLCKHVNIIETIRSLSDKFCYLMMVSSAFQLMLLLVLCYTRARRRSQLYSDQCFFGYLSGLCQEYWLVIDQEDGHPFSFDFVPMDKALKKNKNDFTKLSFLLKRF